MRTLVTILFLTTCFAGFCQQPVNFTVTAKKIADNNYEITVAGKVEKGWRIYAQDDEAIGLEGVQLTWENANVLKTGELKAEFIALDYKDPIFDNQWVKVYQVNFSFTQAISIKGTVPSSLQIIIKGFAARENEFIPFEETKEIKIEGGVEEKELILSSVDLNNPVASCGDKQDNSKSLLYIFILGFGGGLLALITPCIFPMIPVTVGFFTGKAKTKREGIKNAILYGGIILFIYLLASVPFHLIGDINPQIFNIIATNAWVNLFFFAIFIFFALSFFGLFEIKLPARFANTAGAKSGIFFMALTLVIVSFSCTGIILGSLLVNALSVGGSAWQLTAGMGGFGLALALPFGLFAMFPQWLKKLPRSGGWLQTVKISLAFIELALAIKFLSNADLVEHWGILKREVFIGLWIMIFLVMTLYLFYERTRGRMIAGTIVLAFVVYLVPGLSPTKQANLKLLSGFPPPLSYSVYGKNNIHGKGLEPDVVNDYEKALQLAKEQQKPILIDFTGWACVNCRKMEEQIWTKPSIKQLIKDNYILVSLYVDDRKKMENGRTVGEKWASFQADNFKQVTQPLYVVLSPEEKLLNHPVGYTPKESSYKDWLECGLNAYKSDKPISMKIFD